MAQTARFQAEGTPYTARPTPMAASTTPMRTSGWPCPSFMANPVTRRKSATLTGHPIRLAMARSAISTSLARENHEPQTQLAHSVPTALAMVAHKGSRPWVCSDFCTWVSGGSGQRWREQAV